MGYDRYFEVDKTADPVRRRFCLAGMQAIFTQNTLFPVLPSVPGVVIRTGNTTKGDKMKRNSVGAAACAVAVIIFCMQINTARSLEPPLKTPDLMAKGKRIYEQRCASCHGILGNGRGRMAAVLNPAPNNFTEPLQQWEHSKGDPAGIFRIIKQGLPDSAMVGYDFADDDVWALVYTVMGFSDRKPANGLSGNGAVK